MQGLQMGLGAVAGLGGTMMMPGMGGGGMH
jgi:hypothetical protein